MAKISPLIRTRLYNFGYNRNFIVYPNDFSDSDIDWAISCVEKVMSNSPVGIQRLIASKGDKKIAGFACRLSEFADNLLPEEKQSESKNYTYDKNGTNIPAFLGFAFTGKEVPNVTPSDIWRLFMKNLADKWHRNFVESIAAGYSEPETIAPEPPSDDEKLFRKYLAEAILGDVAVIIENGTARKIPQPQPKAPEPPEKKTTPPELETEQNISVSKETFPPQKTEPQEIIETAQTDDKGRSSTPQKPNIPVGKIIAGAATAGVILGAIIHLLTK